MTIRLKEPKPPTPLKGEALRANSAEEKVPFRVRRGG